VHNVAVRKEKGKTEIRQWDGCAARVGVVQRCGTCYQQLAGQSRRLKNNNNYHLKKKITKFLFHFLLTVVCVRGVVQPSVLDENKRQ